MADPAVRSSVKLAELLGVLSLVTDLGMGQPMEHVLRQCLISLRLAQRLGLEASDREVVYYAALLAWLGCHVDAYEQAKWFGDDTALKADFRQVDFATPAAGPLFMLCHLAPGLPAVERARLGVAFLAHGRKAAVVIDQDGRVVHENDLGLRPREVFEFFTDRGRSCAVISSRPIAG